MGLPDSPRLPVVGDLTPAPADGSAAGPVVGGLFGLSRARAYGGRRSLLLRKQGSTSHPILFCMIDALDHLSGKTGLSPTITLSKNGATPVAAQGAIAEINSSGMPGWYAWAGNANDRSATGDLAAHITAPGADPMDLCCMIVPWDPLDGSTLGLSGLGAVWSDVAAMRAAGEEPGRVFYPPG